MILLLFARDTLEVEIGRSSSSLFAAGKTQRMNVVFSTSGFEPYFPETLLVTMCIRSSFYW
jgi:hypothetical protein